MGLELEVKFGTGGVAVRVQSWWLGFELRAWNWRYELRAGGMG